MSDLKRVSRHSPCPVCQKPDWCSVSEDGNIAICMRVKSEKRTRNRGFLHKLKDAPYRPGPYVCTFPLQDPSPSQDWSKLAEEYQQALPSQRLNWLADKLGLSADVLAHFNCGWSSEHKAFTFPMWSAKGEIQGIHLRFPNGKKLTVKGGKLGLFLPNNLAPAPGGQLLVAEGLTDTAALTQLGFSAIGRPSCSCGNDIVCELARKWKPAEVVIMADQDEPGQRGADNLASALVCYVPVVRVITPPEGIKDARKWLAAGATKADVQAMIDVAPMRRLLVTRKAVRRGR